MAATAPIYLATGLEAAHVLGLRQLGVLTLTLGLRIRQSDAPNASRPTRRTVARVRIGGPLRLSG